MRFYLGTHVPTWLHKLPVPLFVSHRRLRWRKSAFKPATCDWCLDSGGFSELSMDHEWKTTPEQYVWWVKRYKDEIGRMVWAAPQDWMCEPIHLQNTGKTVAEHQRLTVENFLTLMDTGMDCFIPVLQGWERDDYMRCIDLYAKHGVDLSTWHTVGLGSVCRRQNTDEIYDLVRDVSAVVPNLHGFGVKSGGLKRYGTMLKSADSMAWSYRARVDHIKLPGCTGHINCANCWKWAMKWRLSIVSELVHYE